MTTYLCLDITKIGIVVKLQIPQSLWYNLINVAVKASVDAVGETS